MNRSAIFLRWLVFIICVASFVLGCTLFEHNEDNIERMEIRDISDDPVQELVEKMTLEEKIGQMMIIGFAGSSLTVQDKERIETIRPGGVILFSRNVETPEKLITLTNVLQTEARIPYFVAVDQEGGMVNRINFSGIVMPGAMAIGATGSERLARTVGRTTGEQLAALGINMNLAPVLDINTPWQAIMGTRSFGQEPELVARLGAAYIKGLHDAGIACVGKHFPGHGGTSVDSHFELPRVDSDMDRLRKVELIPFRQAIEAGVDAVMSAHIVIPSLDESERPATLSKPVLTTLLREELEFNGVILTDDLEMKAISDNFGAEAGVLAVQAGADMLLVSHTGATQEEIYRTLFSAVQAGEISEDCIDESVRRILRLKSKLGLLEKSIVQDLAIQSERYYEALDRLGKVAQEVADQSVTVVFDQSNLLPLSVGTSVLIVSPTANPPLDPMGVGRAFAEYVHELGLGISVQTATIDARTSLSELKQQASQVDVVILVTHNVQSWDYQVQVSRALFELGKPLIVVASSSPYDAKYLCELSTYITIYGPTPAAAQAVTKVLVGDQKAVGKLPVTLPKYKLKLETYVE